MNPDGLAALDLARAADADAIGLAMEPRARLVRQEMQRVALRQHTAEPLRGLHPGRVRRAVVIAVAGDRLRVNLDPPRWRPERMEFRRAPKILEEHVRGLGLRNLDVAPLPEFVEGRQRHLLPP